VKRAFAVVLLTLGVLTTSTSSSDAQSEAPDTVDVLTEYFERRVALGYTGAQPRIAVTDPRNDQTHPFGQPSAAGDGLNDLIGIEAVRLTLPNADLFETPPLGCDLPRIDCTAGSRDENYDTDVVAVRLALGDALSAEPLVDRMSEYAIVLRDPSGTPWVPNEAFPLDGFGGMTDAFVLSGGQGEPWSLQLRHHDPTSQSFVNAPADARVLRVDNSVVFFFPPDALDAFDAIDGYAFTTEGAPTPDVAAQDTIRELPNGTPIPINNDALEIVAPVTSSTLGRGTGEAETLGPPTSDTAGTTAPSDTDDDRTALWAGLAIGGGALVFGGALLLRRGKQPVAIAADGTDTLSPEALAAIGREFGPSSTAVADDPDVAWAAALGAEHAAQERLLRAYGDLLEPWAHAWQRFREAAVRYAESYLRANAGSEQLQQLARDWQVRKEGAQAADLAVAIIQIVRGVGKLGAWGWRWLSSARSATAAAERVARAEAMISASPTLQRLAADLGTKGRADELVQLASMADEAGMSADELAAVVDDVRDWANMRFETLLSRLDYVFIRVGAKLLESRGFVRATAAEANAVHDLLNQARAILTRRDELTWTIRGTEQVDALAQALNAFRAQVQANPGYLEKLPKLYDVMAVADVMEGIGPVCTAADLAFLDDVLRAAETCGNDLSRFRVVLKELVGPASSTAAEAAAGAGVVPTTLGAVVAPAVQGTAMAAGGETEPATAPPIVGAVGSVDAYVKQFGIAGDSLGGHLWDFLTAPIESTTGLWTSLEGVDAMQEFLESHESDLVDLGPALADAIGALEQLMIAANGARLHDPTSTLGGDGQRELQQALDDLRRAFDRAPDDWQASHDDERVEREAHMQQKLATINRTTSVIGHTTAALPQLIAGLDALRRTPDGTRVGAVELLNPDIAAALTRILALLEGTGAQAFAIAPKPVVLSPDDEAQVQAAIEANRRMLAGEAPVDWETPDFSDLPPADD
jgi:hypothetical protein